MMSAGPYALTAIPGDFHEKCLQHDACVATRARADMRQTRCMHRMFAWITHSRALILLSAPRTVARRDLDGVAEATIRRSVIVL
jgi:hypothetical protein